MQKDASPSYKANRCISFQPSNVSAKKKQFLRQTSNDKLIAWGKTRERHENVFFTSFLLTLELTRTIKPKKSASLCYFDTCFMQYIGGVSDRRWHDTLSMSLYDQKVRLSPLF